MINPSEKVFIDESVETYENFIYFFIFVEITRIRSEVGNFNVGPVVPVMCPATFSHFRAVRLGVKPVQITRAQRKKGPLRGLDYRFGLFLCSVWFV